VSPGQQNYSTNSCLRWNGDATETAIHKKADRSCLKRSAEIMPELVALQGVAPSYPVFRRRSKMAGSLTPDWLQSTLPICRSDAVNGF
jgi:hypothetical protein